MTPPQPPQYSGYPQDPPYPGHSPYPAVPAPGPTKKRRYLLPDVLATVVLSVVVGLAAVISAALSLWFGFVGDSCRNDQCFESTAAQLTYPVTFGGIAVAVVGGLLGIGVSALCRWPLWVWPAMALVVVVASFIAGALLTHSVYACCHAASGG